MFFVEVELVIFRASGGDDFPGETFELALADSEAPPRLSFVLPTQPLDVVLLGLGDATEIGRFDFVEAFQCLVGRQFKLNLAARHEVHPIGILQCFAGMLLHDQRASPVLVSRGPHGAEQPIDDHRRQAEGQLVGEQERRLATERSGEGQHLLLATRQHPAANRQPWFELRKQRQRVFD